MEIKLNSDQEKTFEAIKKHYQELSNFEKSSDYKKMNDLVAEHHTLENDYLYASMKLFGGIFSTQPSPTPNPTSNPTPTPISGKTMLAKYFSEDEFEFSVNAVRKGISNQMDENSRANAIKLLTIFGDSIRDFYNKEVIILSGFRNKEVNALAGGVASSEHQYGNAMDFIVKDVDLKTVFNDIALGRIQFKDKFDQLIFEFSKWIHIGRRDVARKQIFKTVVGANNKILYIPIKSI